MSSPYQTFTDGECEYTECRDPEHCSMGGSCETAVPAVTRADELADRMWALADRWETRADELSERTTLRLSILRYGSNDPRSRLSVHYRLQASGLRAELRAMGYERQAVQR